MRIESPSLILSILTLNAFCEKSEKLKKRAKKNKGFIYHNINFVFSKLILKNIYFSPYLAHIFLKKLKFYEEYSEVNSSVIEPSSKAWITPIAALSPAIIAAFKEAFNN